MSTKKQMHNNEIRSSKQRSPKPTAKKLYQLTQQQIHPATIIQRSRLDPKSLTPQDVLQLQRTIGNQAVGRLFAGTVNVPVTHGQSVQYQDNLDKENKTGLPDDLKDGIENLSRMSMDDVKVHYHSSKPAQLQALAYTQGTDIYVGSGQEKHLPHEAWHVVQQKQGRVKQTFQARGVIINDAQELEREADDMGAKAFRMKQATRSHFFTPRPNFGVPPIQAKLVKVGENRYADDDQEDSLVNDGDVVYELVVEDKYGLWMADNWGEIILYDPETKQRMDKEGWRKVMRMLNTNYLLFNKPLPEALKKRLSAALKNEPEVIKSQSKLVQDLTPEVFPHIKKTFQKSETKQITQDEIANGASGDYAFEISPARLSVRYGGTELGFMTYTKAAKGQLLKVGELEVNNRYRGMNISRILMVMLAQLAVKTSEGKYSAGQDTDITNKGFWAQYSNNAITLLRRGDHQKIDVPDNPTVL